MTERRQRLVERVLADPRAVYPKGFHGVLRDHRLDDSDRVTILRAWPSADDFERAQVAAALQELAP